MSDRLAVLTSCLYDEHDDCPAWVPDPCPDDPENLTCVVCTCDCHDHEASHVGTPAGTLEGALPPY